MRANYGNYVYNNVYSNNGTLLSVLNQQESLSNSSVNYLETRFTGNSPLGNNDKRLVSDYFVTNASFLRMDNINIGYTFDNILKSKASITLNGTVQNAFVLTKYKGIDPELGSGIDNNFYPRPRIFVLGLTLSL
jgi:iron complex outermembrane receptor protein